MGTLSLKVSLENLAHFLGQRLGQKENRFVTLLSFSVCLTVSHSLCLMLTVLQDWSNAPIVLCSLVIATAVGLLLPAHAHSLLRPEALPLPAQPRQQEFHRGRYLSEILNKEPRRFGIFIGCTFFILCQGYILCILIIPPPPTTLEIHIFSRKDVF